jgi:capsular polysaccharide biosynthesis protein
VIYRRVVYGVLVASLAVVLVAWAVTSASLMQTPTYQTSAQVWVDQKQGDQQTNLGGSREYRMQPAILTMAHAIDSRPVAEEVMQRLELEMPPAELLDNLAVEQVESTSFISLTYESTDPVKAAQIANTVAEVSSELISERSAAGSQLKATVYEEAVVPDSPTSPHPLRNGLLTLVIGLGLCAGTVVALPGVGARVAGTLGERPSRQGTLGQAGVRIRRHSDYSIVERVKEKKLLLALGRRGKLTAVEAALESELSVEEANRMLQALALQGQLEVKVEDGKLLYSFWGHEAP